VAASKFPGHSIGWLAAALLASSAGHAGEPDARAPSVSSPTASWRWLDRPRAAHTTARNAAGATSQYYGGPVVENAKIYAVWWGDPAQINPAITAAKGGIADFFAGIMNSSYIDWLDEYNTTINAQVGSHMGMAGTGQRIGRGNYAGAITLANVPSGSVTDAQIQSTIDQALTAGTLPPPDDNTLYALFFPKGVTITLDGTKSCNGFGAYHDAITETQRHTVYYLVVPDCGSSFNGITATTSHELIEAITDTLPTAGSMPDYPQAWNDSMGNEMGDLCEGGNSSATVTTALGTFTVQNIWDERTQACKVFSADANDFNVAVSPNVATVALDEATTFTVQTGTSAGTAQMVTLSATAPTGVTATVSPTAVTSGATATLTVTVTSPPAQSGLQVVVRADATAGSAVQTHTAALLLTTTAPPPDLGPPPADLAEAVSDLAPAPGVGGGGAPEDMRLGGGATAAKGCGCVIGAGANASALDGAWPQAALFLAALVVTALRRRPRRGGDR
jgi:hypothetical protein